MICSSESRDFRDLSSSTWGIGFQSATLLNIEPRRPSDQVSIQVTRPGESVRGSLRAALKTAQ